MPRKMSYYGCGLKRGWVEIRKGLLPPKAIITKAPVQARQRYRTYDFWGTGTWYYRTITKSLEVISFEGGKVIDILRGRKLAKIIPGGLKPGVIIPLTKAKVEALTK